MQKINLPKRKKFRKTKIQPFTDPARSRPKKAFDPSTIPVQGSLEQDESRRSGEEEGLRDVINEIEDRVDTQGEDVHLFSAPQPTGRSQAHTTRRHNEAENYKVFRESYAERFGSFSFEKLLEAKCTASRQALQQFVMSAARQAKCACCGMSAQECGDPVVHVPVKLLSLSHALDLEIPIYQCTRCSEAGVAGSKLFHVHPSMTGSVAGSALLGSNLLEGSYERERTWYDIELLEYLRLQRKNNARMAIDSFTQTMEELHRRNGQPFPPRDTVRRQLGRTLEEYENILFINNSEVRDTVEGTSLIDCCPACTGMPKEEGQDEQSPDVQRFQAYGDGNFRLPHLTTAGTATQHAPVIQHRLLPDSEVKEFCLQRPEDLPPIDDNTCNDFQADKQLGRTKQKFDITGVFGIFCRHGMLICALNMLTGERWSYATCLLHALLTANIAPSFWWYDINCRYKGHFLRWLQKCSLSEGMKTAAASMMFPLPTWHHSMHNAQCQATNSFRTMQGAGRGAGEPPEAAWAHFGPYGYILQYASLPARVAALERIAAYWNAAKLVQLPNLLLRMYIRAHTASEAAREEEAVVINLALQSGITEDQVVEAVIELKTARDTIAPLQALDWRAEYVDLLLQQADILKQVSSRVSPDMLSFSVSGSNRQSSVTRKIKVTNRIWHIERDHSIEESWQPGTAEYEDGLSRLRCSKLEAIQQQISELVQQLHLTEEHFQRQATQRGATKRLQNVKEQQRKKIQAALCFWTHWHAIAPVLEGPIPEQPQTEVRQETLHAACRGEYPWNNSNPNAGLLEVTAARCKTLGDIMDRCSEEMDLVEAEAAAACETLQKQQERIKARLVSLQLSIAGLENEATAQSSQLVDIAVAQSQCDRGKKLDGLKGMQSILIKKQSDLDRLKGSLCDVVVRLHYSAGIDHVPQIQGTTSDAELDAIRDEVYADHEDQIFESLDYCSDDE